MSEIKVPYSQSPLLTVQLLLGILMKAIKSAVMLYCVKSETDKVVMEVVAQADGVFSKILKQVDDTVLSAGSHR